MFAIRVVYTPPIVRHRLAAGVPGVRVGGVDATDVFFDLFLLPAVIIGGLVLILR